MSLTHPEVKLGCDRPEPNVSIILAERVLAVFEESGTTPKEQNVALDIARTIVLDRLYSSDVPQQPVE